MIAVAFGHRSRGQGAAGRIVQSGQFAFGIPAGHSHPELVWFVARQDDGHHVGIGQLPHTLGDLGQGVMVIGHLGQEHPADVDRCGQPRLASPRLLVESSVLDRDARRRRQGQHHLLVLGGELVAQSIGQVEIAEDAVATADRHAQETAHRRMVGRKAD